MVCIMTNIVNLPLTRNMNILECDECRETSLNLYISKDFKTLAYRCIACNYTGYFHMGEDETDGEGE